MSMPSPKNARAIRLLNRTGVEISMGQKLHSVPNIGDYGTEAYAIGKEIKLQRRNVLKMVKEGWLEPTIVPEDTWEPIIYRLTDRAANIDEFLETKDFEPKKPYFSADEIKAALREWYRGEGWIFLTELAVDGRRVDGYALGLWRSTLHQSIGFEIKVSRSDLLADIRNPEKRQPFMENCHQFFYVTTRGLATYKDIPGDCGLIEIGKNKSRHVIVDAPVTEAVTPSWQFVGQVAWRSVKEYYKRYDWMNDRWVGEDREIPDLENPNDYTPNA